MNEHLGNDSASDVPWPTSDHRLAVPDTSMLPGSENAPPPAAVVLKNVVKGAHHTIDRMADRAAPVVNQLGKTVTAATDVITAKTEQLRVARDDWAEGARSSVRRNPLASIAGALALGALFARLLWRS